MSPVFAVKADCHGGFLTASVNGSWCLLLTYLPSTDMFDQDGDRRKFDLVINMQLVCTSLRFAKYRTARPVLYDIGWPKNNIIRPKKTLVVLLQAALRTLKKRDEYC